MLRTCFAHALYMLCTGFTHFLLIFWKCLALAWHMRRTCLAHALNMLHICIKWILAHGCHMLCTWLVRTLRILKKCLPHVCHMQCTWLLIAMHMMATCSTHELWHILCTNIDHDSRTHQMHYTCTIYNIDTCIINARHMLSQQSWDMHCNKWHKLWNCSTCVSCIYAHVW